MSGKPALDDYFDALLGEAPAPAAAPSPAPATVAEDTASAAQASAAAPPATPMGDPLDELEAVFEQAHAEAKAAGVFSQATSSAPAHAAPMGDPLDELEAVFEQAHAEAKAAGVFSQAPSSTPAHAAPMGDPLDELEAVFEQAHAEAKAAGVFSQTPSSAPAHAAPMGDPLDELEAVFEQAHAEAKAAGVFSQADSPAAAIGPSQAELDELEAAFDAAAEAAAAERKGPGSALAPSSLPTSAPMPEPAKPMGLLKPQLERRSEAVRRRLAQRREEEFQRDHPPAEKIGRWLRFQMGGQNYAVELLRVQEVQRVPDIMPVRGSAPHVVGIMNLRGQVISVVDLGRCIGLAAEPVTEASRVIVLETETETVGLLVCSVAEVISLPERAIENPVSSIPALPKEALVGIARHAQGMSVLLDATVFLR